MPIRRHKAGNSHGLTVSVEHDNITEDVLDLVVDNQTTTAAWIQIGQSEFTVSARTFETISLRTLSIKIIPARDSGLAPLPVPVEIRWPA